MRARAGVDQSNGQDGGKEDGREPDIVAAVNQDTGGLPGGQGATGATTDATAVVRFAIGGLLRFLSHAETLRVFQRACARAYVPVKFTEGFNPHPKLSLPLPRPVGVASDDELLVLRLSDERGLPDAAGASWPDRMGRSLSETLPREIELKSVEVRRTNAAFVAEVVDYAFPLRAEATGEVPRVWPDRIAALLSRRSIVIERQPPRRPARRIDVRGFLQSIRMEAGCIVASCAVTAGGSIRVDEIMQLLELSVFDLAGPIRRGNVTWKTT